MQLRRTLSITDTILYAATLFCVALGLYARWADLGFPEEKAFDENHYVVHAIKYLNAEWHFNDHPPFGKFLIGVGISLFGDNGFGWRFIPACLGTLFIAIVGGISHSLFRRTAITCLALSFCALDGSLIAYSRTALLDGILVFFSYLGLFIIIRDIRSSWITVLSAGICVGLATATKYNGSWVLFPLFALLLYRKQPLAAFAVGVISVGTYGSIIFFQEGFTGVSPILQKVYSWQQQSLSYHTSSLPPHRYSSAWYSWLFVIKPVGIVWRVSNEIRIISTITNPVVTCGGLVLLSMAAIGWIRRRFLLMGSIPIPHGEAQIVLIAYAAALIPWIGITRPAFQYHYIPSYVSLLIYTSYVLGSLIATKRLFVYTFLVVWISITIFVLPLSSAFPLSPEGLRIRILNECWENACPRV